MDRLALWDALEKQPWAAWMRPEVLGSQGWTDEADEGRLLWCGIGGSLSPAHALVQALGTPEQRRRWLPLVAPGQDLPRLEPGDRLVFASKSGRTLELWTWISHLRTTPGWGRWRRPPLVLTQDDGNPLARLARDEGWTLAALPSHVGGRFSAFTPIGTLPIQWMGRDAEAFLQGARRVVEEAQVKQGLWGLRVWQSVEKLLKGYRSGVRTWVLMPYSDRLQALGGWWAQLVAESLGKIGADGARVGLTPVQALGPQDQHSQLQRWMSGPRDIGLFLLTLGGHNHERVLHPPSQCPFEGLDRFRPSQILEAEAEGTHHALVEAGIPVSHWKLEAGITEADLGGLLMSWQLIVALVGLALEVNPFDQPAVEVGKRWTESLLSLGLTSSGTRRAGEPAAEQGTAQA
ncbi:MAG TPA: hypothetical protein VJ483_01975 [Holophagaceae bacterium]|nr:hypothetical protein [Holophagaceae bacterium]